MAKGGIHTGSLYLFSMIGKGGVRAKCNVDLLDSVAFTLVGLVGPWIIGGDFNCTPEELIATGWLKKVGGIVHAPKSPTCNGSIYDFFVVAASISDQVQSTHLIGDAGLNPHHPSRLIFKGAPRTTMVRHLKPSVSLPAVLPHGPQREQKHSFDALVELNSTMEQNYATLAVQTTSILRGLIWDAEEGQHEKKTEWSEGPKFIWKNVASPPATDKARSTPVSRAWKNTTSWLHVVKANRSSGAVETSSLRASAASRRPRHAAGCGRLPGLEEMPVPS